MFKAGAEILRNDNTAFEAIVLHGFDYRDSSHSSTTFLEIKHPKSYMLEEDAESFQKRVVKDTEAFLKEKYDMAVFLKQETRTTKGGLLVEAIYQTQLGTKRFQEIWSFLLCPDKFFTIANRHFYDGTPKKLKEDIYKTTVEAIIESNSWVEKPFPSLGAKVRFNNFWKYDYDGQGTVRFTPFLKGLNNMSCSTLTIQRIEYGKNPIKQLKSHYEQLGYVLVEEEKIDYGKFIYPAAREIKYAFEKPDGSARIFVYYTEGKAPFKESYLAVTDGYHEMIRLSPLKN